jgi:hypothetical protein
MKAITIKQPWAWAIAAGYKTIENRTTNWSYRGPLAIHAGRHDSRRGWESPLIQAAFDDWRAQHGAPFDAHLTGHVPPTAVTGAIIAVADLVDIHPVPKPPHPPCCQPWGEQVYLHLGKAKLGLVHLVLADARQITPPIDCTGALGLWTPPTDIAELLAAL